MFNYRAIGGPPVEHPEIYKARGNIFFAVACALLLCFSLVVLGLGATAQSTTDQKQRLVSG